MPAKVPSPSRSWPPAVDWGRDNKEAPRMAKLGSSLRIPLLDGYKHHPVVLDEQARRAADLQGEWHIASFSSVSAAGAAPGVPGVTRPPGAPRRPGTRLTRNRVNA